MAFLRSLLQIIWCPCFSVLYLRFELTAGLTEREVLATLPSLYSVRRMTGFGVAMVVVVREKFVVVVVEL